MHFAVRHTTRYGYDVPVVLGPHRLRLTPRRAGVQLISQSLRITPQPSERTEWTDAQGNHTTELHFSGTAQQLEIESRFELETLELPALAGPMPPLPWTPRGDPALEPCYAAGKLHPSVRRFAESVLGELGSSEPLTFLDHLCHALHTRFERRVRPSGHATASDLTLASGRGASRDLAQLFMDSCRALGLPARFASGYKAGADPRGGESDLHGWPEIWLGELGFRGWDPTRGMRVAREHVALCAAPLQSDTLPVEGGFTFSDRPPHSTLEFHVELSAS